MARLRDKADWIGRAVTACRVLYIGSVDSDPDNQRKHRELHRFLHDKADRMLGIYRDEAQAALLRNAACEAATGDAESLDLHAPFDLVVASDVIEHLSNPGRFLDGARTHLVPGGRLLVTTPNPWALPRVLEHLVLGRAKANLAHTCWFNKQVLSELARRHGFQLGEEVFIDEMYGYQWTPSTPRKALWMRRVVLAPVLTLNYLICRLIPRYSETLGFSFVTSVTRPR